VGRDGRFHTRENLLDSDAVDGESDDLADLRLGSVGDLDQKRL